MVYEHEYKCDICGEGSQNPDLYMRCVDCDHDICEDCCIIHEECTECFDDGVTECPDCVYTCSVCGSRSNSCEDFLHCRGKECEEVICHDCFDETKECDECSTLNKCKFCHERASELFECNELCGEICLCKRCVDNGEICDHCSSKTECSNCSDRYSEAYIVKCTVCNDENICVECFEDGVTECPGCCELPSLEDMVVDQRDTPSLVVDQRDTPSLVVDQRDTPESIHNNSTPHTTQRVSSPPPLVWSFRGKPIEMYPSMMNLRTPLPLRDYTRFVVIDDEDIFVGEEDPELLEGLRTTTISSGEVLLHIGDVAEYTDRFNRSIHGDFIESFDYQGPGGGSITVNINEQDSSYFRGLEIMEQDGRVFIHIDDLVKYVDRYRNGIKTGKVIVTEEDIECPICFETSKEGTKVYNIHDKHTVCCACVINLTKDVCPLCRQEFTLR